jgi:hypothetical protein
VRLNVFAALFAASMTAGCIQSDRLIKINGDGSGSVIDTVKLGEQAKGMIAGLEQMDKTPPAEKKAKKDAKLKEQAVKMGVTFVSDVKSPDGTEKITWTFTDANKVKLDKVATTGDMGDTKGGSEDWIAFRFAKTPAGALLTVVSPKPVPPSPGPKKEQKPEEKTAQRAQMKALLAGLKMSMSVEVNGTIVKTDSPYVAGNVVTLMSLDFDQMDENGLDKLQAMDDPSKMDTKALAGVKGVKFNLGDVAIEFKPR